MNAYERFDKTIDFQLPDRVLTWDAITNDRVYQVYGGAGENLMERAARTCRAIGLDATTYIHDPQKHWMVNLLDTWAEFMNLDRSEWEAQPAGETWWITRRPFRSLEVARRYLPRLASRQAIADWYVPFLKEARKVFYPQTVFVAEVLGPVTFSCQFLDMQQFCTAIIDEPELVHSLLEVATEWCRTCTELYAAHPTAPALLLSEDIAYKTSLLFSPAFLRRELLPRLKYIYEPLKRVGLKCLYHSDGHLHEILDDLVFDVGIDGLNPLEPMAGMDPAHLRKRYPNLILLGGVDTSAILPLGTAEDIEQAVRTIIREVGPSGGLGVGSSNEVHPFVPVENAVTMYKAVQRFGSYPISPDV